MTAQALPRSGDVVVLSREASVQFVSPILFRVIRVQDETNYSGWCWLDGYQLSAAGEAAQRRSVFVLVSGLRTVDPRAPSTLTRNRGRFT